MKETRTQDRIAKGLDIKWVYVEHKAISYLFSIEYQVKFVEQSN